jgi:hypothetical protein
MKVSRIVAASLLAITWAGSNAAYAEGGNPLQPSYFWAKTQMAQTPQTPSNSGDTVAMPMTNPLHPSYFAAKVSDTLFVPTAVVQTVPYADRSNPLHPRFERS